MESIIINIFPKLGLIIGAVFCLSPLPTLLKAVTSDKSALNSLSIPGAMMGLSCSTSIFAFCLMKDMTDCVISCSMFIAQGVLMLLVYSALNKMLITYFLILISQAILAYCVFYVFTIQVTDTVNFVLNTLSCVLMPLDQLDKLLKTKDLSFVSYIMNFLAGCNAIVWGFYHLYMGTVLSIPNFAGLACTIVLLFGILFANGTLSENNPLVSLARLWAFLFFNLPKKLLGMSEAPKVEITKKPTSKGDSKKKR